MKSIMEEASSVSKAVDQAWTRAGKPAEFTIKVLELPERNMFGLTVKSAKIAFFFDERKVTVTAAPPVIVQEQKKPVQQPQHREEHRPKQHPQKAEHVRPAQLSEQHKPIEQRQTAEQRQPRWNEEMVATARQWLADSLAILGKSSITFSTATSGNNLTVHFSASITGDQSKDRLLFSGFANIIMATLRVKYKKSFRFNKVILLVA